MDQNNYERKNKILAREKIRKYYENPEISTILDEQIVMDIVDSNDSFQDSIVEDDSSIDSFILCELFKLTRQNGQDGVFQFPGTNELIYPGSRDWSLIDNLCSCKVDNEEIYNIGLKKLSEERKKTKNCEENLDIAKNESVQYINEIFYLNRTGEKYNNKIQELEKTIENISSERKKLEKSIKNNYNANLAKEIEGDDKNFYYADEFGGLFTTDGNYRDSYGGLYYEDKYLKDNIIYNANDIPDDVPHDEDRRKDYNITSRFCGKYEKYSQDFISSGAGVRDEAIDNEILNIVSSNKTNMNKQNKNQKFSDSNKKNKDWKKQNVKFEPTLEEIGFKKTVSLKTPTRTDENLKKISPVKRYSYDINQANAIKDFEKLKSKYSDSDSNEDISSVGKKIDSSTELPPKVLANIARLNVEQSEPQSQKPSQVVQSNVQQQRQQPPVQIPQVVQSNVQQQRQQPPVQIPQVVQSNVPKINIPNQNLQQIPIPQLDLKQYTEKLKNIFNISVKEIEDYYLNPEIQKSAWLKLDPAVYNNLINGLEKYRSEWMKRKDEDTIIRSNIRNGFPLVSPRYRLSISNEEVKNYFIDPESQQIKWLAKYHLLRVEDIMDYLNTYKDTLMERLMINDGEKNILKNSGERNIKSQSLGDLNKKGIFDPIIVSGRRDVFPRPWDNNINLSNIQNNSKLPISSANSMQSDSTNMSNTDISSVVSSKYITSNDSVISNASIEDDKWLNVVNKWKNEKKNAILQEKLPESLQQFNDNSGLISFDRLLEKNKTSSQYNDGSNIVSFDRLLNKKVSFDREQIPLQPGEHDEDDIFTIEDCKIWINNPNINPKSGKIIRQGSLTYRVLEEACKEYDIMNKENVGITAEPAPKPSFIDLINPFKPIPFYCNKTYNPEENILKREINYFSIPYRIWLLKSVLDFTPSTRLNTPFCFSKLLGSIFEKKQTKIYTGMNSNIYKIKPRCGNFEIIRKETSLEYEKFVKIVRDESREVTLRNILNNHIPVNIPNYPILYHYSICDRSKKIGRTNGNGTLNMLIEKFDGSLEDIIYDKNISLKLLKNLLKQCLIALASGQHIFGLVHGNINSSNFLYKKVIPGGWWRYNFRGDVYIVENMGYFIALNDFDKSYFTRPYFSIPNENGIKIHGNRVLEIIGEDTDPIQYLYHLSDNPKDYIENVDGGMIRGYDVYKSFVNDKFNLQPDRNIDLNDLDRFPPSEFLYDNVDLIRMFIGGPAMRFKKEHKHTRLVNEANRFLVNILDIGDNLLNIITLDGNAFMFSGKLLLRKLFVNNVLPDMEYRNSEPGELGYFEIL